MRDAYYHVVTMLLCASVLWCAWPTFELRVLPARFHIMVDIIHLPESVGLHAAGNVRA